MCNLQTLAAKGLVRPNNTDGKAPHGAMRVWPIVAVPATTPNMQQPPGCTGKCDQGQGCLAQQEGVNK